MNVRALAAAALAAGMTHMEPFDRSGLGYPAGYRKKKRAPSPAEVKRKAQRTAQRRARRITRSKNK